MVTNTNTSTRIRRRQKLIAMLNEAYVEAMGLGEQIDKRVVDLIHTAREEAMRIEED